MAGMTAPAARPLKDMGATELTRELLEEVSRQMPASYARVSRAITATSPLHDTFEDCLEDILRFKLELDRSDFSPTEKLAYATGWVTQDFGAAVAQIIRAVTNKEQSVVVNTASVKPGSPSEEAPHRQHRLVNDQGSLPLIGTRLAASASSGRTLGMLKIVSPVSPRTPDTPALTRKADTVENPFRPTAGATPPEVIGRTGLLDEFKYGLRLGSGAPGLLTIITGARGIGKTVMLGAAQDAALEHGWAVISETANGTFMGRIGESMRRLAEELGDGPPHRKITAITVAGFGITTQLPPERQVDWRRLGENLLRILAERGTGLIITVDEIHAADRTELAQLATTVQHFIRDGLPIGLVFAGLPSAVSDLLNEGVTTFLRRADRIDLHAAAVRDVEASYDFAFEDGGFSIETDLVNKAAAATGGYPFLIQLVGYFLWQEAEAKGGIISAEGVDLAIEAAGRRHERTVLDAALAAVSAKDLEFLQAMAKSDGSSSSGEIGLLLNAKPNLVSKYRTRLMAAGLIDTAGYGRVDFAIPGLREHMRKRR